MRCTNCMTHARSCSSLGIRYVCEGLIAWKAKKLPLKWLHGFEGSPFAILSAYIPDYCTVHLIPFGHRRKSNFVAVAWCSIMLQVDTICIIILFLLISLSEWMDMHVARCLAPWLFIIDVQCFVLGTLQYKWKVYLAYRSLFLSSLQHIMIDLGTGNNNKVNWAMTDKQEFIDIVETVYRGARKGRGLVVSPKDYSTKYRY